MPNIISATDTNKMMLDGSQATQRNWLCRYDQADSAHPFLFKCINFPGFLNIHPTINTIANPYIKFAWFIVRNKYNVFYSNSFDLWLHYVLTSTNLLGAIKPVWYKRKGGMKCKLVSISESRSGSIWGILIFLMWHRAHLLVPKIGCALFFGKDTHHYFRCPKYMMAE